MKKFIIIFILLICCAEKILGAIAAEPHTDADLKEYGARSEFDATVFLKSGGSASRIVLDRELPFDIYITAAHCFEEISDELTDLIFSALMNEAQNPTNLQDINLDEFVNRFSELIEEKNESVEDITNLIQQIVEIISSLFEKGFITDLPSSIEECINILRKTNIYSDSFDRYEISSNGYVLHPHLDLAVFTTFEKTEKPAYRLSKVAPHTLVGKKIVNVGFGIPAENPVLVSRLVYKQAFNSKIASYNEEIKSFKSEVFMPTINLAKDDFPTGLVTGDDSGGSLLIKNGNDDYYLIGVTIESNYIRSSTSSESLYSDIPAELKMSKINQECNNHPYASEYCYGGSSAWQELDFDFIERAVNDLLQRANKDNKEKDECIKD